MIHIGKTNTLKIVKQQGADFYLGDETSNKILLVDKAPTHCQLNDSLEVFVYVDTDGHLAATRKIPLAQVDEIAWLPVVSVNYTGAFLAWGLPKDLLVPFSEQHLEMEVGHSYLVKLFLDDKSRVVATTKINRFLAETSVYFKAGEKVSLLIAEKTDLGIKAIINHTHWGMLYHNELFQTVQIGQKLDGYIKQIREDLKIDLTLHQPGYGKVEPLTETILAKLQANNGVLMLSDKSPPEAIYAAFGVSKKAFKQAIGALYKDHKIILDKTAIKLVNPQSR
ncbi:CvfB family protein [Methylovulum miyakonense]|uniref:CvfB family protein n=1 Tax=Methylovulum miyakonense TaxID=645578 RepID=UPI00036B05B4|nr:S1-like domain-containing RNA-binding protein [Methylovulum miyakonense]